MKIMSGIYKIVNLINGKFYVGSAKDICGRWIRHRSELNRRKHHNIHLENAWHKYGSKNFLFIIIERLPSDITEKELFDKEDIYLKLLKPEYNISPKATGGNTLKNHPRYQEICKLISFKVKQQFKNGRVPLTLGKHLSQETKEKIIKHHKIYYSKKENCSMYGKKHSLASKIKNTVEHKDKRGRSINQIDTISGEIIKVWDCIGTATRAMTGKQFKKDGKTFESALISNVCAQRKNANGSIFQTAYGFKWEYSNKNPNLVTDRDVVIDFSI